MSLLPECQRWSETALLVLDDETRGGTDEMHLQAALGMSLMFMRGQNEAVLAALNRSLAIAEDHGDARTQLRLLNMLHTFHGRLSDRGAADDVARRGSVVSKTIADPAALALGHRLLGMVLHHMGDHGGARVELEAALRHGAGSRAASTTYFGFDGHILAGTGLARTLWLLGYPVQAAERARQTVKEATDQDHPIALSMALVWAIFVFLQTGDFGSAEQHIDWFMTRAESQSLGPYLAVGRGFKGQLAILRGDVEGGVESLRRDLEELHAARYELLTTVFNISLVQGLALTGQFGEGMALIDQTIRQVEANEDFVYTPELLRVKGGLLLSMSAPAEDAEICFMRSLELSRRQGARAWELRTTIDLATMVAMRGQAADARALLQPVFASFVEGFDTADLQAAERLLTDFS
jgi:tetratricopeptide (TPR) repeat protein